MLQITIRKSVDKKVSERIPQLLTTALQWMQNKYPCTNFDNVGYIFSANYSRSRYFRNEVENGKYLAPNVCILTKATLHLYDKKSLGIKKTTCRVGYDAQIISAIIHELTHHVQYETKTRKGNETDTTANELEYLKEYYPHFYSKIVY